MNISICIPSYKRPKVETLKLMPYAKVYVDEAEADEYKRQNLRATIVSCPKGVQGNLCRIRNYILKKEFENEAEAVIIVDDDYQKFLIWEQDKDDPAKMAQRSLKSEEIYEIIQKYSEVCRDLGFKMWGVNCTKEPRAYKNTIPLSFSAYLGGPFQAFIKRNELLYDERLPLKEDYDMTLQQCNKYRGCLRVNFLSYIVRQSEQKGGCASIRTMKKEKEQLALLQKKWGQDIVRIDKNSKRIFDYNPIIKIPLRGV